MCIYIYTRIYNICMHACTYVCVYVCMCMCMCMCICICFYVYVYVYTCLDHKSMNNPWPLGLLFLPLSAMILCKTFLEALASCQVSLSLVSCLVYGPASHYSHRSIGTCIPDPTRMTTFPTPTAVHGEKSRNQKAPAETFSYNPQAISQYLKRSCHTAARHCTPPGLQNRRNCSFQGTEYRRV